MKTHRSLPSELTIYTVGELHPQWLAWLHDLPADDAFAIDAAAVEEVDAAGVQLLLSLQRSLVQRQQALRLVAPSRPLATACTALGLAVLVGAAETSGAAA